MATPESAQSGPLSLTFAGCSQLRDALGQAIADLPGAGDVPWIPLNPAQDEHAWAWFGRLIRRRSDWRECAGIALQHAVLDGADVARTALADLVANDRSLVTLATWVDPLVTRYPDVKTTQATTGWGGGEPEVRLADVARDQAAHIAAAASPDWRILLIGAGLGGGLELAEVADPTALSALLARTADAGVEFETSWGRGPWGWLYDEVIFRPWVAGVAPGAIAEVVQANPDHAAAALDWLWAGWDLDRFAALLTSWQRFKPIWWANATGDVPAGWRRAIAPVRDGGLATWGDVVDRLVERAAEQRASTPDIDLSARV